jgi:hypothetical protein
MKNIGWQIYPSYPIFATGIPSSLGQIVYEFQPQEAQRRQT